MSEMSELQGTIKNGQIILDAPAALPEGTRVEVLPIRGARPTRGMREEDWPTPQEGSRPCWPGWTSSSRDGSRRRMTPLGEGPYAREGDSIAMPFADAKKSCGAWRGNDSVPARHRQACW